MQKLIAKFRTTLKKNGIKTAIRKSFFGAINRILLKTLPNNLFGDLIYAKFLFLQTHKRWPQKILKVNDVLFNLKVSKKILDPLRIFVSDKELVKLYIKAKVGDKYNIPTLGVIRNAAEVDNYQFPERCCIKPTHTSNRVIIRKNNENIDLPEIKTWFSLNYYKNSREANYKYLTPKVIIESLVFDCDNAEDYRFFCYKGEPKIILIDIDIRVNRRRLFFDTKWNEMSFSWGYPKAHEKIPKPDNLDEMLNIARKLSADFDFIRIDIYSNGKSCFVGEITNCHASANSPFIPLDAESKVSDMIFEEA
jgi:hypothetical protein